MRDKETETRRHAPAMLRPRKPISAFALSAAYLPRPVSRPARATAAPTPPTPRPARDDLPPSTPDPRSPENAAASGASLPGELSPTGRRCGRAALPGHRFPARDRPGSECVLVVCLSYVYSECAMARQRRQGLPKVLLCSRAGEQVSGLSARDRTRPSPCGVFMSVGLFQLCSSLWKR